MADRKRLKNPNGLFLGTPGSGKSFASKREIVNVFLSLPDDDIIIADPEGEYYPLVNRLGVLVVGVVGVDVHGVDERARRGRRGQPHHLTAQPVHQRGIFILRVADDDVILCGQHDIGDLPLAAHGFSAARRAEHQTVWASGLLAV